MKNIDKLNEMLLEDIIKVNGNDFEKTLNSMIEQINDKNILKMTLKSLIENELLSFSYKIGYKLDKMDGK